MGKKVLTEEELSQARSLKDEFDNLVVNVGDIETQILSLEIKKEDYKNKLRFLKQEEIKLSKELEAKYGKGTISLDSGEFLPNK